MLLYHGTKGSLIPTIWAEGVKPRSTNKSNWEMESRADLVYMTRVYAGYFAFAASDDTDDAEWGIVEIDSDKLDESNFLPDEDFIEQASRARGDFAQKQIGMEAATKLIRENLEEWRDCWALSLDGIGNCAYQGIVPPKAITRVAIYDPSTNRELTWSCVDPCISILNYKLCSDKYSSLTMQLFDSRNSYVVP